MKDIENELAKARKDFSLRENKLADEMDRKDRTIRELNNQIALNLEDKKNL